MGEPATVTPIRPGATLAFARGDHVELAERVLERLRRPPAPEDDEERDSGPQVRQGEPLPILFDVGDVWRYGPPTGIWTRLPGHEVRNTVAGFAGSPLIAGDSGVLSVNASTAKGVEQVLRDRLLAEPGRVGFGAAPPGMAFANGFLVVQGGKAELRAHGPMNLARWRYEFTYKPYIAGMAPLLERFLGEIFADVEEPERGQRIALWQEFLGACLVGDAPRYQRYLVMFARGGNGKSELLRIARATFPAGTVTSIEPQKWKDDRHAAALEGVRANFVDELPDDEIMGGANVKRIVTGEPITARAVYKDAITFSCRAGHIFATNVEVQSTDHSDGFWERPLVLVLSRKFRQSPGRVLEAARGIVEQELSAIVAWAVEGAMRAQRQGGYTEPGSSKDTLREWRDDNDQVRGFVADKVADRPGRWAAATLYEEYKEWAKANGCAVMSSAKFGRRMAASGLATRGRDAAGRFYVVGEGG